jgi:hypothetical protein
MDIADVRLNINHLLAVEHCLQVKDTMCRRMVRTDIEKHRIAISIVVSNRVGMLS